MHWHEPTRHALSKTKPLHGFPDVHKTDAPPQKLWKHVGRRVRALGESIHSQFHSIHFNIRLHLHVTARCYGVRVASVARWAWRLQDIHGLCGSARRKAKLSPGWKSDDCGLRGNSKDVASCPLQDENDSWRSIGRLLSSHLPRFSAASARPSSCSITTSLTPSSQWVHSTGSSDFILFMSCLFSNGPSEQSSGDTAPN